MSATTPVQDIEQDLGSQLCHRQTSVAREVAKVRVLLVEDDDRVAEALVPALTRRGFHVDRQATGRGTLEEAAGALPLDDWLG